MTRTGLTATAGCLLLWPLTALATNGYFAHGYSVAQKALGGAGTALPTDALIATINPAGMAFVGNSFEINLSLFTPIRDYSASERGDDAMNGIVSLGPIQSKRSQNEYYPIPALSYNREWGERMTWGVSMYGNGGLNTEYTASSNATFGEGLGPFEAECRGVFGGADAVGEDAAGFCGNGRNSAGVDLAVLFLSPSVSYRIGSSSAVGVAPLLALSRFAATGLGAFAQFSNAPEQVTDNGHEVVFGAGYRIGLISGAIPYVNIGASYQSRVWMDRFEDYQGLFAQQGDFDIPASWNLGLALRPAEAHRVLVDFQRIRYSSIASVGLPLDPNRFVNDCAIPRLLAGFGFGSAEPSEACLGASTGPGFGWQDMDIWKFGYQYSRSGYTFRVGYSQTDQPIPSTEVLFNVLAPGVIEQHFTAGVALQWTQNFFVEAAFMYAPSRTVRGKNPLSNTDANLLGLLGAGVGLDGVTGLLPGGSTAQAFGPDENDQDLSLRMRQYEMTVGIAWRY